MNSNKINPEAIKTIDHICMRWKKPNKDILKYIFPLLAKGKPVSPSEIMKLSGHTLAEVEEALTLGRTDMDQHGNVTELFGIMFDPTLHRIEVGGIALFSCCALIAHVFARLSGQEIIVESVDPISRNIVRLAVKPDGVSSVVPADAVGSMVLTSLDGVITNVGKNFCTHIHHFISRETAEIFISENPKRYCVDMDEFHGISKQLHHSIWEAP